MRRCHECGTPLPEAREVWKSYAEALGEAGWDIRVRASVQTCEHCGDETVTISRPQALNQVLAEAIAKKPLPLAPAEIGFIRAHLRLNGRQLAAIIGVDEATVSRWLGGQRPPSSSNDRHLRLLARLGPSMVEELCPVEAGVDWSSKVHATVEHGEWLLAAEG